MVSFLRVANSILAFTSFQDCTNHSIVKRSTFVKMVGSDHILLQRLQSIGLEKKDLPHHKELKRASVLVPLFERSSDSTDGVQSKSNLHVLFTQRPTKMSSHAGEVCFPGGRQDEEDNGDDVVTATREAYEEVGLHPQHIKPIGRMETVESKHSLCVTPIIGLIEPSLKAEPSNLILNADEVEVAFAIPLAFFADPCNCVSETSIQYGRWKNFIMREFLFDDDLSGRQFRIWGLTAHIVYTVAHIAFEERYN